MLPLRCYLGWHRWRIRDANGRRGGIILPVHWNCTRCGARREMGVAATVDTGTTITSYEAVPKPHERTGEVKA